MLATSDVAIRGEFIHAIIQKDQDKALSIIQELVSNGKDIKQFMIDIARDCQTMVMTDGSCREFLTLLISAFGQMKLSPIAELPLELAVMEYCMKDTAVQVKIEEKPASLASQRSGPIGGKVEIRKEEVTEDTGLLSLEKLVEHWKDVIEAVKPYNHSIAGVLRSAHPKAFTNGVVTIATLYKFHQERLSDVKVRGILADVLKKLFGVKVNVEIVLEKP